jgi:CubicO group peptidase (beta-lactamase class C family)
MTRTVTSVRDLVAKENFATPHKTLRDSSKPIAWMNWDSMAAAGGIISSSDDMSLWLRAQLRSGELADGKRLFSERSSNEMFQAQMAMKVPAKPSARFPSTHFRAYGLGWALSDYKGVKVIGHGGGYDGMYSQVLMVPEQKLGVVVLTNSMTSITNLLAYRALDLFLGGDQKNWSAENLEQFRKSREEFDNNITKAITPVAKDTKPSHPTQDYAGLFRCRRKRQASLEAAALPGAGCRFGAPAL